MVRWRIPPAVAAALVGAAAFALRMLATGAIENDHFVMLARAHQVLYGDWPVRDFEDPGMPLAYLMSAAAAAMFSATIFVNVIVSLVLFGITAGLTYLLARRASGTAVVGLVAAAVAAVVYPRLCNTTKCSCRSSRWRSHGRTWTFRIESDCVALRHGRPSHSCCVTTTWRMWRCRTWCCWQSCTGTAPGGRHPNRAVPGAGMPLHRAVAGLRPVERGLADSFGTALRFASTWSVKGPRAACRRRCSIRSQRFPWRQS